MNRVPAARFISQSLIASHAAEFERDILRERVKAGIAHAREQGKRHGRPPTAIKKQEQIRELEEQGMSNSEIARRLKIGRSSVIRMLK